MQLDVESLRTFLTVLEAGGMTRASERLHLSQSAVSRKIQRLEQRVGRPLLIRDGHSLRPTRDGRSLLDDARTIVEVHDRAVARLSSTELSGTVRLGTNGEVDARQVATMLGSFKLRHPMASVEFITDHSGQLIQWVEDGKIDLAIFQASSEDVRPGDIVLWTEELCWATSWEQPFEEGLVPLVDFGEHCFYREFSQPNLAKKQIESRVTFSGSSSRDVYAAVAAGIGVTILARRYLDDDVVEWQRGSQLAPLPDVHQILRTVPGEQPAAVAALVETICSELKDPLPFAEASGGPAR